MLRGRWSTTTACSRFSQGRLASLISCVPRTDSTSLPAGRPRILVCPTPRAKTSKPGVWQLRQGCYARKPPKRSRRSPPAKATELSPRGSPENAHWTCSRHGRTTFRASPPSSSWLVPPTPRSGWHTGPRTLRRHLVREVLAWSRGRSSSSLWIGSTAMEDVELLAQELERNLQAYKYRESGFWEQQATEKVGWRFLVQLADVASLLVENNEVEKQWKNPSGSHSMVPRTTAGSLTWPASVFSRRQPICRLNCTVSGPGCGAGIFAQWIG